MEEMTYLLDSPTIICYFPIYTSIPAIHLRKDSKTRAKIREVSEIMKKADNIYARKTIRDRSGSIDIYEILVGDSHTSVPAALIKFIRNLSQINPLGLVSSQKKYLLISHNPVDLHLSRSFSKIILLESFTGKFFKPEDFGTKIFKSKFIPFNSVTHMLFGDDTQIFPMAKRNNRKLLLDLGMRNTWKLKTKQDIAKQVEQQGQVPYKILMTPIFGV